MYWERHSKDDFFQTCKAPCAICPFAPLSMTSRCRHELFGFLFEDLPGLQDQNSISALGWWIAQVLACTPHHFLFANNCCLLLYAEMVQDSSSLIFSSESLSTIRSGSPIQYPWFSSNTNKQSCVITNPNSPACDERLLYYRQVSELQFWC